MKLRTTNLKKENTTYLQGIGHTYGTPASELKTGDTMVWNNGSTSKVGRILKETPKTVTVEEIYISYSGEEKTGQRKFNKSRIVARPVEEITYV